MKRFKVKNHTIINCDTYDCSEKILKENDAELFFVDPPYDKSKLYSIIPVYKQGHTLIVSYGYRTFMIPNVEAHKKKWQPCFQVVWDCCTSWYIPNNPLVRHKTFSVYGEKNKFNITNALIEEPIWIDSAQQSLFGGEENILSKKVKNSRSEYVYTPTGKHLATVYRKNNATLKKSKDSFEHQKPLTLIAALLKGIEFSTAIDFYAGSGVVALTCAKIGKSSISLEIDSMKCEKIASMLDDYFTKC